MKHQLSSVNLQRKNEQSDIVKPENQTQDRSSRLWPLYQRSSVSQTNKPRVFPGKYVDSYIPKVSQSINNRRAKTNNAVFSCIPRTRWKLAGNVHEYYYCLYKFTVQFTYSLTRQKLLQFLLWLRFLDIIERISLIQPEQSLLK